MEYTYVTHEWEPVYDSHARVLILGSIPSVKSRENGFYYGHPQNRFWKLIARIVGEQVPITKEEKIKLLLRNQIAIWDVIASCYIVGSSDASIRNATVNNISKLLSDTSIERILVNGATAKRLYDRYVLPETGVEAICMPSTSPANAAWSLERLEKVWGQEIKPM